MAKLASDLVDLLDLEQVDTDVFVGASDQTRGRIFGGQAAGQALIAAGRTVEGRRVHSFHAYFLRPGDPTEPVRYEVNPVHEGRSFARRNVVGLQRGEAIISVTCSFQSDEDGPVHDDPMPAAPAPETLTPLGEGDGGIPQTFANTYGLDLRFVTEPPWRRRGPVTREQLWLRATGPVGEDPLMHAAILTFATDMTLMDMILGRHGLTPYSKGFAGASLDHCVWYHRPWRADNWLLYDQTSPVAYGARGLARGLLYAESGEIMASVVQEGLIRLGRPR